MKISTSLCSELMYSVIFFVELGGGVGDVLVWSRGEAYVKFGFR